MKKPNRIYQVLSTLGVIWCMVAPSYTCAQDDPSYDFSPARHMGPGEEVSRSADTVRVASDGLQRARAVYGEYSNIFETASTDGGLSWSDPILISPVQETNYKFNRWPDIATDGHGTWIGMWTHEYNIHYRKTADDGTVLTPMTQLPSVPGLAVRRDNRVTLDTYGNGVWIAAYHGEADEDHHNNRVNLMLARSLDNGETWESYLPEELADIEISYFNMGFSEILADRKSKTAKVVFSGFGEDVGTYVATLNHVGDLVSVQKMDMESAGLDRSYVSRAFAIGFNKQTDTWIACWTLIANAGGTEIFYSKAANGGAFSAAQALFELPDQSSFGAESIDILTPRDSGEWVITFGSSENYQYPGGVHEVRYYTSQDDGESWQDGGEVEMWDGTHPRIESLDSFATGFGRMITSWIAGMHDFLAFPVSSYSGYDQGAVLPDGEDNDLVVNGTLESTSVRDGSPFKVSYDIVNQDDEATTEVLARIMPIDGLTLVGVTFEGGAPVSSKNVGNTVWATYEGIAPGASRTIKAQYVASESGTFFVNGSATAEAGDVFPEDNLHRFVEVDVEAGGLRGGWYGIRTRSFAQGWTNVQSRFVMRNNTGQVEAPAYAVIYKSEDAVWDESDVPVKYMARPSLAPGQWFSQVFSTWHNPNPSGQYYIAVINAYGDEPQPYPIQIP